MPAMCTSRRVSQSRPARPAAQLQGGATATALITSPATVCARICSTLSAIGRSWVRLCVRPSPVTAMNADVLRGPVGAPRVEHASHAADRAPRPVDNDDHRVIPIARRSPGFPVLWCPARSTEVVCRCGQPWWSEPACGRTRSRLTAPEAVGRQHAWLHGSHADPVLGPRLVRRHGLDGHSPGQTIRADRRAPGSDTPRQNEVRTTAFRSTSPCPPRAAPVCRRRSCRPGCGPRPPGTCPGR